jgi:hypothetical protein
MGKRPSLRELATKGNSLRLRQLILSAYPAETWVKKFRRLDPVDQFRLWAATEPKELLMDSHSTFTLQITGLPNKEIGVMEADCSSNPAPLALKRGSSSNFKEGSE